MKAKIIRGKLVEVDGEHLTIEPGYTKFETWYRTEEPTSYAYEELDIDEDWIKRFLGSEVECILINNVIKSVKQA